MGVDIWHEQYPHPWQYGSTTNEWQGERMEHSKELQCLKVAAEMRVTSAEASLTDLQKNPPSFNSPMAGVGWDVKWKEDIVGRIQQVFLIPVVALFVCVSVLMVPVCYVMHIYGIWKSKRELKKTIKANTNLVDFHFPAQKTIESLWRAHGFGKYEASMEEEALLLERWIEILYGKDAVQGLNLYDRLRGIRQSRIKGDLAYYRGESSVHCHFGPAAEALVRQLSEEFPPYC